MRLYATDTGQPTDVPDESVPQALASQKYGLPPGDTIPVQHKDGTIAAVPIAKAYEAFSSGAVVVPRSALESAQLQEQYGGPLEQAKTAVEQGLGGATLGLSTAIEGGVLGNSKDILARERANPGTAAVSQVAGALLPTLLAPETGAGEAEEASALSRAAGTIGAPSRLLSRGASGIGDAVRGALGVSETDSLVSAVAKQAVAHGAEGLVEGAGYGAAQHLTEESLGDPDANGESLLAAAGHGALLGLGAGAGLGAAGEIGSRVLGRIAPALSRGAEEAAVRAVSPRAVRALQDLPGGARAAGRRLIDDGLIKAGDTADDVASRLPKAAEEAEQRAARSLASADEMEPRAVPIRQIMADGQKEVAKLRAQPLGEASAATMEKQLASIERAAVGMTWDEAAARGLNFGAMSDGAGLSFADTANLLGKLDGPLRGIVAREFDLAGSRAARRIGGHVLEEYKDASLAASQYRALASTPPPVSGLSLDYIAGMSGMLHHAGRAAVGAAIGAAAGDAEGGDGGALGGLVAGAASALAHHAIRARGLATGAVLLDKLATLRGVERAAQRVDREIARGIAGAVPGARRAEVRVSSLPESYEERAAAVRRAAASPQESAALAVQPIQEHAPKAAAAFQAAAVRATGYLASLLPTPRHPPSITPQLDRPPQPSPKERATFMRASDVAHDPMVVLRATSEGRVTSDQVKALAAIYPALYARFVIQAQSRLADVRTPLSSVQRHALETLLGKRPDVDLQRRYQATYAAMRTDQPTMKNQDQQHKNRQRAGTWVPKRPIKAPAEDSALQGGGRPTGS